jgi:predicted pyridoxine 5'-phosphate oxidase superfamily flavin-nucleotide-binding protein
MQGAMPSILATCNAAGIPNAAHISQVFYVDERHVALSFQFFNKTARNIRENPWAHIRTIDPASFDRWEITARYVRSDTEGPVFDDMDMQLEAIASMTGMSAVFKLKAADIYEVVAIHRLPIAPP